VRIEVWAVYHALAMLAAVWAALLSDGAWPLVILGGSSFGLLAWNERTRWTPEGAFGAANAVTALRLIALITLLGFHVRIGDLAVVGIAAAVLAADWLDGWLARRRGESSRFGEFLDKETDAFWLLALTAIAALEGQAGRWVLGFGLLRYGFVLAGFWLAPSGRTERRSPRAAVISIGVFVAVLALFVLPRSLAEPLAIAALVLLAGSFAVDVAAWFRPCKGVRLTTAPVRSREEAREFFDRVADGYREQHGDTAVLLAYRMRLLRTYLRLPSDSVVLEVGCGPGDHVLELAPGVGVARGVDFSPRMVEIARARAAERGLGKRCRFWVDDAEVLATVSGESIDALVCIGAFEHMWDKGAVIASFRRVLRPGGQLFMLTTNGEYWWYRWGGRLLGYETRHLSSDRPVTARWLESLLERAGFSEAVLRAWSFVPRGDISDRAGRLLQASDGLGRLTGIRALRGGILAFARKP